MNKKKAAFTQLELGVVVVISVLLVLWVIPTLLPKRSGKAPKRIVCVNNLKQIGVAYRVWSTDNGDLFPAQSTNGWVTLLTNGKAGAFCWTNYALMHSEFGESPKVLICPADVRRPAASFGAFFWNTSVSYFVGVGANDSYPQSILAGDRNLCYSANTAGYGFSPADGTGSDVLISTNPAVSKLSWSQAIHTPASSNPGGNLLLADGSVQQCSGTRIIDYQPFALDSGNFASNAVPKTPSFRLVFP